MEITLMILAAGMASRYGAMKQTEGFGPTNETIMDYSIYDAIHAGFTKVVFIIRKDFSGPFRDYYDAKLKDKVKVEYVYQDLDAFVDSSLMPPGRVKPWGTGHALLCAASCVNEPFAVINADDFYGRDGFVKAASFLTTSCNSDTFAIIGYPLAKTLSEFGAVSRGVCTVDSNHHLLAIHERTKIVRKDGVICYEEKGNAIPLNEDANVSMNFWCFHPSVFSLASGMFQEFIHQPGLDLTSEFFIPLIADTFIKKMGGQILLIPTDAQWFGVTYKEDAPQVKSSLHKLISEKTYPQALWQ